MIIKKPLVNNDVARVASFSNRAIVINAVESEDLPFHTTNLLSFVTVITLPAGVNKRADTNVVSDFEPCDIRSNLVHYSSNLMP